MHFKSWFKNEKGYALATVLIVLSLISLLVGFMIIGITTQNRFIQNDIHLLKARYSAEAAIYQFLLDPDLWSDFTRTHFELITTDDQEVSITRIEYGGYWVLTSDAEVGGRSKKIRVMVGQNGDRLFNHAIVLGDVRTPLNLTGSTSVNGDILTGLEGVQYRPFRGEIFSGSFSGNVSIADSSALPLFRTDLVDREIEKYRSLIETPPGDMYSQKGSYINIPSFKALDDHTVFFKEGNLSIQANSPAFLPDSTTWIVTGNLTVNGELDAGRFTRFIVGDTLTVNSNLKGEHTLFYAGKLARMAGNTNVSAQIISEGDISLSGKNYLRYPSLLYVKPDIQGSIKTGTINVKNETLIEGVIMISDIVDAIVTDEKTLISIGEGVTLKGAVYNTSRTEMSGTVYGTVMTNQFYFYNSPTTYLNWLKDAQINIADRPSPFAVPIGFSEEAEFEILYREEIEN